MEARFIHPGDVFMSGYGKQRYLRDQLKKVREAGESLGITIDTDTRYYVDWAMDAVSFALAQCPLQPGDKVRLIRPPKLTKESGWYHCRHFLVKDAPATVHFIDIKNGVYKVDVKFDNESWIPGFSSSSSSKIRKGVPVPVEEKNLHLFLFPASSFEKREPSEAQECP